ncbi:MAG: amidohydrolase family protein [Microbacterium sp.]|uniref:amidohydrolase family protein n=1 Tax=Microbacterium sp. TaxID=51671 RepID=UPI002609AB8F|nr:amidohydrolase family protein [Microbacterium sp.]MCX6503284.1 amidohydrolase family protein [Microbacterium sp.]
MTVELHRAPIVLPVDAPAIVDGAVAVRAGRILAVGPHDELAAAHPDAARHEWDGALVPGLVNAHTHLQYTSMAEVGQAEHSGFETWMHAFQELYEQEHDWLGSASTGAALSLRGGATAVAEIVTDPDAASAVHEAGLHGVVYWEVMGWTDAAWAHGGRDTVLEQLRRIPSPPAAGLSPHAVYSLDTGVLRDLAGLAAELGVRQHIHAAESAWEDAYVRTGTGELADTWRQLERTDFALLRGNGSGRSVIGYLDDLGSLSPATHLAHGIYVDADDRRILRERGVVVALCPRSNAVIGLDPPPVADYLREGNVIAVGTDSLSSSPSLSLLADVAELHRLSRAQGYRAADLHERLFAAATRGGAVALGLDDAGTLTAGRRADLAVFPIAARTPVDAVAELVESGPAVATATIVAGRVRWRA